MPRCGNDNHASGATRRYNSRLVVASPGDAMSTTLPVVLIVDDEIRSLETLRRTLEEAFEVFTAASTDEALAILQNEFIHVVISDQRMPDMTGVAFLKLVRERWPEVARIILSGDADN